VRQVLNFNKFQVTIKMNYVSHLDLES